MTDTATIVRIHELGDASVLRLDTVPLPDPGPGEVRLRVKAIGLNRAEIMLREGKYLWQPELPAQIGFEASGVVEALGAGVDPAWLGRAASCMPTFSPVRYGVYGEVAVLPAESLAAFPARLSFEQGTALWGAYLTAWGGLVHFGRLSRGDAVLVTAASSGTGMAAIDVVNAEGGTSIAVTRTPEKRDELIAQGAAHVIVSDEEDVPARVAEITGGRGARIVYDPVGGPGLATLVDAAAKGGTLIAYGLLSPEATPLPLFGALLKYLTIKAYDVHEIYEHGELLEAARRYVFDHVDRGTITPRVAQTFALADIVDAHRAMEAGRHIGKIVVVV